MPKIYMIRHGHAAAGWDADKDPGLSPAGREQAEAVAREIERKVGDKLPVLSSPLRRCLETAAPLCRLWGVEPRVEPRVAEIPSPIEDLNARGEWLRGLMTGTWAQAVTPHGNGQHTGAYIDLLAWRQSVIDALAGLRQDTVIFSHFIAINVVAGHALEDPRVVAFRPDNCSVTIFDVSGSGISLAEKGREADTKVN